MIKYSIYKMLRIRGDIMKSNHIELKEDKFNFIDLVDMVAFEQLLRNFYKATGVPSGLVAEDGKILSQVGWVKACALFHRTNPQSNAYCQASNLALMKNLREDEIAYDVCKNGLIDYATPIVIEGQRIATLFLGQVLNEPPKKDFFHAHAKELGYDEKSYIKAIEEVPIVSKERMQALMDCMVGMAQMLASNSLARLHETLIKKDLNRTMEQRIELEDILDASSVGIGWSNLNGTVEYVNHQFTQLFGYTLEDIPDVQTWWLKAYPDTRYRETVIEPWGKAVVVAYQEGTEAPELEASVTCKDGTTRHILIRVSWVGVRRLVSFSDFTAHWKSEQRNRAHDSILEMVASGLSLSEILYAIVDVVEVEEPNSIGSILLLDEEGKHLYTGAAPNLPKSYNKAINGVEIGMGVGSCGTAAYLGKRVIVEDIKTHEYWKDYRALAESAGLGACWSEPILSSTGKVLGTFAIYHKKPAVPTEIDIARIHFAANIAAIAIENRNTHEELKQRAYTDYLTNLANRRYFIERSEVELSRHHRYGGAMSLVMFDIDYFKKINDHYGHKLGDLVLQKIAEICRFVLRDIDIVGRIGGEEFTILLPQTDIQEATKVAERLRVEMSNTLVVIDDELQSKFTASFGVVEAKKSDTNIDLLLVEADKALYEAKASGRNRVCISQRERS